MNGASNPPVGGTLALLGGAALVLSTAGFGGPNSASGPDGAAVCEAAPHRVDLESTGNAPGASGWMDLRFGNAPHGVAVTEDGSYRYEISVHVTSVPRNRGESTLVAWAATPNLDRHLNLGAVGDDGVVEGEVSWNKFLVFVTAESSASVETWQGPVLMKATSPSGNMHTMAGHGIFQQHGIGC
ncbi:MAG: hypothetical protein Q8W44_10445 [Candidatus Palauibacterales bacterium]|nr:hypothetical protein [Candidatus Palauibacterales bacterium]